MIRIMDSHAYPGCRAVAVEPPRDGPIHVEFSDGTIVAGSVKRLDDGGIALTLDAYATGKGTAVARKSWALEHQGDERWRVSRRLNPET